MKNLRVLEAVSGLILMNTMRAIVRLLIFLIVSQVAVVYGQTNTSIVITAPAKFKAHGAWTYLTITDTKHSYDFLWTISPHGYAPAGVVSLETNHVYTFTVIEEDPGLNCLLKDYLLTKTPIPRLRRIEDHGKLIWDREVCEVHWIKMDFRDVPIVYWDRRSPPPGEPTRDEELRLFPHRYELYFGGGSHGSDSPKTNNVYVCSECKKAYEKWKLQHKP
jgi:hypothetical protein